MVLLKAKKKAVVPSKRYPHVIGIEATLMPPFGNISKKKESDMKKNLISSEV